MQKFKNNEIKSDQFQVKSLQNVFISKWANDVRQHKSSAANLCIVFLQSSYNTQGYMLVFYIFDGQKTMNGFDGTFKNKRP